MQNQDEKYVGEVRRGSDCIGVYLFRTAIGFGCLKRFGMLFLQGKNNVANFGSKAKVRNVPGKRSIRRKVEVDKIKNNAIVKKNRLQQSYLNRCFDFNVFIIRCALCSIRKSFLLHNEPYL